MTRAPELLLPFRLLVLTGPTASGKTAVAIELALALGGEIVGMDSMQIYRGLPILTAAPSASDRARVPHHLVEVREPGEQFDAKRFRSEALALAAEIAARGRVPILCGGSGLYCSAVLEGLSELPAADPQIRSELMERSAREGLGWLHGQLLELDPISASRLHHNDAHRLVRALEVCRTTGRPYSELIGTRQPLDSRCYGAFTLEVPREQLYRRIDARASAMFEDGALRELATVLGIAGRLAGAGRAGPTALRTARQMLGVPQLLACLAGEESAEAARERLALDTRHFARKQLAWFRKLRQLQTVEAPDGRSAREISAEIMGVWRAT